MTKATSTASPRQGDVVSTVPGDHEIIMGKNRVRAQAVPTVPEPQQPPGAAELAEFVRQQQQSGEPPGPTGRDPLLSAISALTDVVNELSTENRILRVQNANLMSSYQQSVSSYQRTVTCMSRLAGLSHDAAGGITDEELEVIRSTARQTMESFDDERGPGDNMVPGEGTEEADDE